MSAVGGSADDLEFDAFVECRATAVVVAGEAASSVTTFGQLYRFSKTLPEPLLDELKQRAKETYSPYKRRICEAFAQAFNALPTRARSEVILNLMGFAQDEEVYLSVHDDRGHRILDHHELAEFLAQREITAIVNDSGNAAILRVGGKDFFRLNASAANTQGLSPPCFRAFYMGGAEDLLRESLE
jgi:hypothetical protein